MAKFADVIAGPIKRRPGEVIARDGKTKIKLAFRLLMTEDDAAIEEAAVAFAEARKVKDPKPGNTQYERGIMVHTLMLACLDPDVVDRDEPFFASPAEISKNLDDSRALHLYFQQRAFQREVSPNPGTGQDPLEYVRLLYASVAEGAKGGDPALPFVGLPYGTLLNFAVESARLLSAPLQQLSPSGSSSGGSTPSSSPLSAS